MGRLGSLAGRLASPAGRLASLATLAALLSACGTAQVKKDYGAFNTARPRAILVVPVVNKSVEIDAPEYFLSTLPVPVAERGYYVFPVNLVKRVLEDDGLADASLVHGADPVRLCSLFGADAVLLASVEKWEAKYMVVTTQVNVEFEYVLKDGKTGQTLWTERRSMSYQPGNSGGGLIGALVNAAVTKASPNYMPLARQANAQAFAWPGPGFPAGPYRPEYGQDVQVMAAQP